jgi:hypothetical protein
VVHDAELEKSIGHLELEFKYNPTPTEERIAALALLICWKISRVNEWFRDKQSTVQNGFDAEADPWTRVGKGTDNRMSDSNPWTTASHKHAAFNGATKDPLKPFRCTTTGCQFAFKTKSDWKRHEETHYPQLEFPCPLPHLHTEGSVRPFPRRDKLLEHLRVCHNNNTNVPTDGRPISAVDKQSLICPICDEGFATWRGRCDHIAIHVERTRDARHKDLFKLEVRLEQSLEGGGTEAGSLPLETNSAPVEIMDVVGEHDTAMDSESVEQLGRGSGGGGNQPPDRRRDCSVYNGLQDLKWRNRQAWIHLHSVWPVKSIALYILLKGYWFKD